LSVNNILVFCVMETVCFLSDHSTRISKTRVPCSSSAWRVCMASW